MSDILKLTPFDASKRALEGTANFRENANYSWGWLAQHASEVNKLIDDLNIYKNGLKDILAAYVQENLEDSVVNKTTLGIDKIDNTADKDKNVLTATKLYPGRLIGGVSFDGSANISLPGVNKEGNQNTTGNAATATKLLTAKNITVGNTTKQFDGSANIAFNLLEIGAGVIAGSNTPNGYIKFSNGWILQWGTNGNYSSDPSTIEGNVNFTIAFPSNCFIVVGHLQSSYGGGAAPLYSSISSWSKTGFVRPWQLGRMAWIAIGY